jgi:hypothetical protein
MSRAFRIISTVNIATTCIDFDGTVNTIAPKELIEERISKRNN